jgi:hypothetical protein
MSRRGDHGQGGLLSWWAKHAPTWAGGSPTQTKVAMAPANGYYGQGGDAVVESFTIDMGHRGVARRADETLRGRRQVLELKDLAAHLKDADGTPTEPDEGFGLYEEPAEMTAAARREYEEELRREAEEKEAHRIAALMLEDETYVTPVPLTTEMKAKIEAEQRALEEARGSSTAALHRGRIVELGHSPSSSTSSRSKESKDSKDSGKPSSDGETSLSGSPVGHHPPEELKATKATVDLPIYLQLNDPKDYKRKAVRVAWKMQQSLTPENRLRLATLLVAQATKPVTREEEQELSKLLGEIGFGVSYKDDFAPSSSIGPAVGPRPKGWGLKGRKGQAFPNPNYLRGSVLDGHQPDAVVAPYYAVSEAWTVDGGVAEYAYTEADGALIQKIKDDEARLRALEESYTTDAVVEEDEEQFDTIVFVSSLDFKEVQALHREKKLMYVEAAADEKDAIVSDAKIHGRIFTLDGERYSPPDEIYDNMGADGLKVLIAGRMVEAAEVEVEEAVYDMGSWGGGKDSKVVKEAAAVSPPQPIYDFGTMGGKGKDGKDGKVVEEAVAVSPPQPVYDFGTMGGKGKGGKAVEEAVAVSPPQPVYDFGTMGGKGKGGKAVEEAVAVSPPQPVYDFGTMGGKSKDGEAVEEAVAVSPPQPVYDFGTMGGKGKGGKAVEEAERPRSTTPLGFDGEIDEEEERFQGFEVVQTPLDVARDRDEYPEADDYLDVDASVNYFPSTRRPKDAAAEDVIPMPDGTFLVVEAVYQDITEMDRLRSRLAAQQREAKLAAERHHQAQLAAERHHQAQLAAQMRDAQGYPPGSELYEDVENFFLHNIQLQAAKGVDGDQWAFIQELLNYLKADIPDPRNIIERHPIATVILSLLGVGAIAGSVYAALPKGGDNPSPTGPPTNPSTEECVPDFVNGSHTHMCSLAMGAIYNISANVSAMSQGELVEVHEKIQHVQYLVAAGLGEGSFEQVALLQELSRCNATIAAQLCQAERFIDGLSGIQVVNPVAVSPTVITATTAISTITPPDVVVQGMCLASDALEGARIFATNLLNISVAHGNATHVTFANLTDVQLYMGATPVPVGANGMVTIPYDSLSSFSLGTVDPHFHGNATFSAYVTAEGPAGMTNSSTVTCGINFDSVADAALLPPGPIVIDGIEEQAALLNFTGIVAVGGDNVTMVRLSGVANGDIYNSSGAIIGAGRGVVDIPADQLEGSYFLGDDNYHGDQSWTRTVYTTDGHGHSATASDTVHLEYDNFVDASVAINQTLAGVEGQAIPLTFNATLGLGDHIAQVRLLGVSDGDIYVGGVNIGRGNITLNSSQLAGNVTFHPDADFFTVPGQPLEFTKIIVTEDQAGNTAVSNPALMELAVANRVETATVAFLNTIGLEGTNPYLNLSATAATGDEFYSVVFNQSVIINGTAYPGGEVILLNGTTTFPQVQFNTPSADYHGAQELEVSITTASRYDISDRTTVTMSANVAIRNVVDEANILFANSSAVEGSSPFLNLTATVVPGDEFDSMVLTGFNGTVTVNGVDYSAGQAIPLNGTDFPSVRYNAPDADYHGAQTIQAEITTRNIHNTSQTARVSASAELAMTNVVDPAVVSFGVTHGLEGTNPLLNATAAVKAGDEFYSMVIDGFNGTVTVNGQNYTAGQNIPLSGTQFPTIRYNPVDDDYFGEQSFNLTIGTRNLANPAQTATVSRSASVVIENHVDPAQIQSGDTTMAESSGATAVNLTVAHKPGDVYANATFTNFAGGQFWVNGQPYNAGQSIDLGGASEFPVVQYQPTSQVYGNQTAQLTVTTRDQAGRIESITHAVPIHVSPVAGPVTYSGDTSVSGVTGSWLQFNTQAAADHLGESVTQRILGNIPAGMQVERHTGSAWESVSVVGGEANITNGAGLFRVMGPAGSHALTMRGCTTPPSTCDHASVNLFATITAPTPPPPPPGCNPRIHQC